MATRKSDLPAKAWDKQKLAERRLASNLQTLTRSIERIGHKYDTLAEIIHHIEKLTTSPSWKKFAFQQAQQMVKMVTVENARTWREAARQGQNSFKIFQALKAEMGNNAQFLEIIRQNANLITRLPSSISQGITSYAGSAAIRGLRAESIISEIRAYAPKISETRARLIARTETAKTQAAIVQVRAQAVGEHYYVWQTSHDQRVRSSHKHMQGVICDFRNPPNPEALAGLPDPAGAYNAGNIYNCRCYSQILLDPDYEDWKGREMVINGEMRRVTKAQFLKLSS